MSMNCRCRCCRCSCRSDEAEARITRYKEAGHTWSWRESGETRQKKKWFGRGFKTQAEEVKIGHGPMMFPFLFARWKTIK